MSECDFCGDEVEVPNDDSYGNFMEGSYVAVPHDENKWERWQG